MHHPHSLNEYLKIVYSRFFFFFFPYGFQMNPYMCFRSNKVISIKLRQQFFLSHHIKIKIIMGCPTTLNLFTHILPPFYYVNVTLSIYYWFFFFFFLNEIDKRVTWQRGGSVVVGGGSMKVRGGSVVVWRWLSGGLKMTQWWSKNYTMAIRKWLCSSSAVADVVILFTKILIIKLPFAIVWILVRYR